MTDDLNLGPNLISDKIKIAADPIRHGEILNFTADERTELFNASWFVLRQYVDKYAGAAISEGGSPLRPES